MRSRLKWWAFFLVAVFLTASPAPAADKQVFKDEAGEVLYTIDENGIVSMFENSPGTDVTLSVTRGTREQMQPQITEITPNTVAAGTYTVLKLEGKNLVGAKVKLSTPAIEVGAYAGKPKRLDVPITVPLSQPLGEVTIEVMTPIGLTTAKFTVTDVQIGGGGSPPVKDVITHPGMGYGADEGSGPIPTTAPSTCPKGMLPLSGEMGGFCIEIDRSFKGDFRLAELHCAMTGRRLCMISEWKRACEQAAVGKVPLKNMKGDWEWTAGFEVVLDDTQQDTAYFLYGKADCEAQHKTMRINAEKFVG
ncbi:MAG TPA: hypothetical protein VE201_01435, partial [Nitrospirales bacterium]|nr:hypothetical protein [Nitrospirales bacterium]